MQGESGRILQNPLPRHPVSGGTHPTAAEPERIDESTLGLWQYAGGTDSEVGEAWVSTKILVECGAPNPGCWLPLDSTARANLCARLCVHRRRGQRLLCPASPHVVW